MTLRTKGLQSILLIALLAVSSAPKASNDKIKDWPCKQRLVPELTISTYWIDGNLEEETKGWKKNFPIRSIADDLADRDTDITKAEQIINNFSDSLKKDHNKHLKILFRATFNEMQLQRARIINGIQALTKQQNILARDISNYAVKLNDLKQGDKPNKAQLVQALQDERQLKVMVYDDREQLMPYVCEKPVLLEHKLYAISKAIKNNMKE